MREIGKCPETEKSDSNTFSYPIFTGRILAVASKPLLPSKLFVYIIIPAARVLKKKQINY